MTSSSDARAADDERPVSAHRSFVATWIHTGLAAALIVAGAPRGAAQDKPDFSGEWVLNRAASTLSPAAASVQSGIVRIEHREPTFRYKAALAAGANPVQYEFELQSDGSELVGSQQGRRTVSALKWDDGALVLTSSLQRADGEMTITFRYELLDGGRRLRAVERIRGGGRDQDNVWLFDRR